jgi:hypothetical protein
MSLAVVSKIKAPICQDEIAYHNFVIKHQCIRRIPAGKCIGSPLTLFQSRTSRIARVEIPGNECLPMGMGNFADIIVVAVRGSCEDIFDANDALGGWPGLCGPKCVAGRTRQT